MPTAISTASSGCSATRWRATSIAPRCPPDLRDRYYSDFVKQWRTYIKSASVVRYAGLKDATTKLAQLSGNQSPLLELFALASTNTAVDDPAVAKIFQPVQAVVPPGSTDRFIAPPNQNYMNALVTIQTSLECHRQPAGRAQRCGGGADRQQCHPGQGQHAADGAGLPHRCRRPHRDQRPETARRPHHVSGRHAALRRCPETQRRRQVAVRRLPSGAQQVPVQSHRHQRSHAGGRQCAVPQARRPALDVLRSETPKGADAPGHAVRAQPQLPK